MVDSIIPYSLGLKNKLRQSKPVMRLTAQTGAVCFVPLSDSLTMV